MPVPAHTPLKRNALTRWSRGRLVWGGRRPHPPIFDALVGMGGCGSAFNATNAIRTTLFFGCSEPPHMIGANTLSDIQHLQLPPEQTGASSEQVDDVVMHVGPGVFDGRTSWPLVIFENFVQGAVSIHRQRCGGMLHPRRLLIGHENEGVPPWYMPSVDHHHHQRADAPSCGDVVYIPQYGTISSLNVVTCLGIGLFYSWLDAVCPASRTLIEGSVAVPEAYTKPYSSMLPHATTPSPDSYQSPAHNRVDQRPIHPMHFHKKEDEIRDEHCRFLDSLYHKKEEALGHQCRVLTRSRASQRPLFGMSVLYENDFDQRNLGGLLRNANAFLVDHVFYLGRRKINVVGAVGCQHYSKPIFLGPAPAMGDVSQQCSFQKQLDDVLRDTIAGVWSVQYLLLSSGQEFLYQTVAADTADQDYGCQFLSHPESLVMMEALRSDPKRCVALSHPEDELRAFIGANGDRYVVLVVPQEGKLPHPAIMRLVEGVIDVVPRERLREHRGLPSQVASGIALQRWCSVAHPELRW